ncbi:LacI family DNA-binding transcriptional regulator [Butyricicoccus faecihominis]|uniref:LacI family DNA-binding transcriptional regulator n=1 Tax=Butyricicoccaceae TaxID=3085642 RepID=UPI002478F1CB|nr:MULTISPECIES: LacI family DNA-binding transcriptional regulator [Butyricicoccaceae]MCQ5129300.1 LacI family DNA-binding transcriptional regulator [Butyricicoccus faecihominis]WNX85016.1 LacI family DNA-binding transcriptional regulator [Agathobaculum sp. NTUH-O15-33]
MAVTQAQIAQMAGVSRGTVDRTLNNRGRVDPEVAERIRRIANELGYRPNRAGSLLQRANRPVRLGVVIQSVETPFMALMLEEINKALPHMRELGAEVIVRANEFVDIDRQLISLDELEKEGVDGIALTPVEDMRICDRIDELAKKMPVVTFNTDLPDSRRLCYVGQENYLSGRACAGLMNMLLGGKGKVLMIAGHPASQSHRRRIDGFRSEAISTYPGLSLLPLERSNDSRQKAYEIVKEVWARHPDLRGIFIAANGQVGVCDAMRELGLKGKVHMICYDLLPDTAEGLREGLIDLLIDQDAHAQGVRPLEILLENILTGARPPEEYMLTRIDIRNQYNI